MMKNRLLRAYLGLEYVFVILWVLTVPLIYGLTFVLFGLGMSSFVDMAGVFLYYVSMVFFPTAAAVIPFFIFKYSINSVKKVIRGEPLTKRDKFFIFPLLPVIIHLIGCFILFEIFGGTLYLLHDFYN